MKDGIYKSDSVYYFVKDDKILMNIRGSSFRTSENFMIGASYLKPLTPEMEKEFNECYINADNW